MDALLQEAVKVGVVFALIGIIYSRINTDISGVKAGLGKKADMDEIKRIEQALQSKAESDLVQQLTARIDRQDERQRQDMETVRKEISALYSHMNSQFDGVRGTLLEIVARLPK